MSDKEESELRKQRRLESSLIQLIRERRPESVEMLVRQAETELQIQEKEIIDCILQLQARGEIRLLKPQREANLQKKSEYARRIALNWFGMTVVFLIITAAVVIVVPESLYPVSVLRQLFGSMLVLWWPGFCFVKALFPSSSEGQSLSSLARIAFSICMSVAIVSVVGLILNYTPWGVRLVPLTISSILVAMFFASVGVTRERRMLSKTRTGSRSS